MVFQCGKHSRRHRVPSCRHVRVASGPRVVGAEGPRTSLAEEETGDPRVYIVHPVCQRHLPHKFNLTLRPHSQKNLPFLPTFVSLSHSSPHRTPYPTRNNPVTPSSDTDLVPDPPRRRVVCSTPGGTQRPVKNLKGLGSCQTRFPSSTKTSVVVPVYRSPSGTSTCTLDKGP